MTHSNNDDDLFEPLSISILNREDGPLGDSFNFALGDSSRIFTDSMRSLDPDLISSLFDSAMSVDIDHMFEEDSPIGPMEFDSTCFDSTQESEPPQQRKVQTVKTNFSHGYNCVRGKSRRRGHSQPQSDQAQVRDVNNFDPAPYDHEKYQKKMKRVSYDDLDVLMEATASAPSSQFSSPNNARPQRRATMDCSAVPNMPLQRRVTLDGNGMNSSTHSYQDECSVSDNSFQYHDGLQKLAESMKRTELSRRQLLMQRTIEHPLQQQVAVAREAQSHIHQQVAINSANQQLQHRDRSISNDSLCIVDQQHPISPNPNDNRSSVMEAFFSGSRTTLTNGLEQSRRQLKMCRRASTCTSML